ncbi:MAG: recombinase [Clostridiales bacterium]|nr:tyrosine-type recombinase/integrase [Bacillota bacterium]PWL94817.1 MAG: recombinase [Clostridiales bacterium]
MNNEKFEKYLIEEKKASANTCRAYERDIKQFKIFLGERGIEQVCDAVNSDIVAYLMELKSQGKTKATLNRKMASIRTYYGFLQKKEGLIENPADNIKTPKIAKKEIDYLEPDEVTRLMEIPDDSEKGMRDKAILELLYATGIRAGELISMEMADLNLRMGFVTCDGENIRARIIPVGRMARNALEKYIKNARPRMVRNNENERSLFVNFQGKALTRQGLWKILKEYGVKCQLRTSLTPQVLRNSFAIHMLQNGADIKSLQELMGHEDISATQVYLAFTKNRIKDVYDRAHPRA